VNEPRTLLQATRYFANADVCVEFVAKLRWPDGPTCPRCEGREHSYLTTRRLWKCKACKKQFSVKVGTIFEDSAIPLDKWLVAVWLIANSKNGISSHELGRALGLSQKSGWFVLHRIRLAMQAGSFDRFGGEVEIDESFIGGKARNMHAHIRKQKMQGRVGPSAGKTPIAGVYDRDSGKVRASVMRDIKRPTLERHVRQNVDEGSTIYTDKMLSYQGLRELGYVHQTIDHAEAYVDGRIHTQGLENFWSLLKRGLHGTYVSVQPFHLFRYLDERLFTFNERERDDLGRFKAVLQAAVGRRLTYAQLTGKS
jgi:transposase-like protein